MRKDLYKEMFRLEETYWWHVAKRRLVRSLLEKYVTSFSRKTLLDIGCGTGKFLEEVNRWKKWKEVMGLDGADVAIKFTKSRGIKKVKRADFEVKLPLKNNCVDVVTSLDVVEHIENDKVLVREMYRVLKNKGVAVVTVPAHQWLWTYWDDMLGHKRRHTTKTMVSLFEEAGFSVEKVSYFYSYLLPVAVFFRMLKSMTSNLKMESDFVEVPKLVNKLLLLCSSIETMWLVNHSLPTGLSVVCVARKKV